jgi:hypothetical protein
MTFLKTVTQRLFGRTVVDSLDLNQNAWYIDEEQVTRTAAQLNVAGAAKGITAAMLGSDVAAAPLSGGNGVAITMASKALTATYLGSDVAGAGLSGGNGVALSLAIPANGVAATNLPIGMVYVAYSAEVDMSDGAAKDIDMGVIGAKGNVVAAYYNITQATDEDVALTVCKAASGASIVVPAYTLAKAATTYPNVVGGVVCAQGTGAIIATDHLYVHVPVQTAARATGKLFVTALVRITA